jgi:hypothetical protein
MRSHNPGSIPESGLYTARAELEQSYSVIAFATSVADPARAAYAHIDLRPTTGIDVSRSRYRLRPGETQQVNAALRTGAGAAEVVDLPCEAVGTVRERQSDGHQYR